MVDGESFTSKMENTYESVASSFFDACELDESGYVRSNSIINKFRQYLQDHEYFDDILRKIEYAIDPASKNVQVSRNEFIEMSSMIFGMVCSSTKINDKDDSVTGYTLSSSNESSEVNSISNEEKYDSESNHDSSGQEFDYNSQDWNELLVENESLKNIAQRLAQEKSNLSKSLVMFEDENHDLKKKIDDLNDELMNQTSNFSYASNEYSYENYEDKAKSPEYSMINKTLTEEVSKYKELLNEEKISCEEFKLSLDEMTQKSNFVEKDLESKKKYIEEIEEKIYELEKVLNDERNKNEDLSILNKQLYDELEEQKSFQEENFSQLPSTNKESDYSCLIHKSPEDDRLWDELNKKSNTSIDSVETDFNEDSPKQKLSTPRHSIGDEIKKIDNNNFIFCEKSENNDTKYDIIKSEKCDAQTQTDMTSPTENESEKSPKTYQFKKIWLVILGIVFIVFIGSLRYEVDPIEITTPFSNYMEPWVIFEKKTVSEFVW